MEKPTKLSEGTLIPISLLITLLLFSAWLTTVYAQGVSNSNAIGELKVQRHEDVDYFRDQVEKINAKLDRILEKK